MVVVFQHLFLPIHVEGKTSEKCACVSGLQHAPGLIAVWWLFHVKHKDFSPVQLELSPKFWDPVILTRKHFNPNFLEWSWLKTRIHCFDIYFCS